ncbi:MAG: fasciclin domain-containing protein [Halobacteriota archaeon]
MVKYDLDIIALVSHLDELSTLYNAIVGAGLIHNFTGAPAVTLFAPENEAFAKLQGGTIISALEDIDKAKTILTYHVVPQKLMASDPPQTKKSVTTLQGGTLKIEEHHWLRHGIKVNGAVVKEADIEGTNCVIHIVDAVLMP